MRIFASDRVASMMKKLGMEKESYRAFAGHQSHRKCAEESKGRNFDIRKQLLDFDDVANDQRKKSPFNELMSSMTN